MRRNIGCHTHGNAGRAVDQQVRKPGRHDRGLAFGTVVIFDEIDRLLVDIRKQFVRDTRHANFGVAHCRGRIAVNGPEVALSVDEQRSHRERLRHANDRVINGCIAMRMVLTDDVTDHAGRFLVGFVVVVTELTHREKYAAMDRLEAVPDIGQGAADDDAHRVIQIGLLHLLFETDGQQFLGDFSHKCSQTQHDSGRRTESAINEKPWVPRRKTC